jgi:prefoldin, beta subunit, archaeal
MDEIPEQLRNDVQQLQTMQQQLQAITAQRQQFELHSAEIANALKEVEKADETAPIYRSIGTILVKVKGKEEVKKELSEEKEIVDLRINTFKKQEEILNGKITPVAQRVSQGLQRYNAKQS